MSGIAKRRVIHAAKRGRLIFCPGLHTRALKPMPDTFRILPRRAENGWGTFSDVTATALALIDDGLLVAPEPPNPHGPNQVQPVPLREDESRA